MSQGVEQTVGRSEPLSSEVHEVGTYEEVDTRVGGRAAVVRVSITLHVY